MDWASLYLSEQTPTADTLVETIDAFLSNHPECPLTVMQLMGSVLGVSWKDLPAVVRDIANSVAADFRRDGDFEPSAFFVMGDKYKRMRLGRVFNASQTLVESILVKGVKNGADMAGWCTEAWAVVGRDDEQKALNAAREKTLEHFPGRIEIIQFNCETATDRYLLTAEIKRDPLRLLPWKIIHDTREQLDKMALATPVPITFQNFYSKAGR